jgi:hypothetical protein
MASMGAQDLRLAPSGKLVYPLNQFLTGLRHADPTPTRVKPAPLSLIKHAYQRALDSGSPFDKAVADMGFIGFFYLCRPGEHTEPSKDSRSQAFRLRDVELFINQRKLDPATATRDELQAVNFVCLIFTKQKNGVEGENVGLSRSGHSYACPVEAIIRRVTHLLDNNAPPDTPLFTVYTNRGVRHVKAASLTAMLRLSATLLFADLGIDPMTISARSLRAGGAMAMLSAGIDRDIIEMTGRWKSEAMMRYLHLTALPLRHKIAESMVNFGSFTLLPGQNVTATAATLIQEGDRLRALRISTTDTPSNHP